MELNRQSKGLAGAADEVLSQKCAGGRSSTSGPSARTMRSRGGVRGFGMHAHMHASELRRFQGAGRHGRWPPSHSTRWPHSQENHSPNVGGAARRSQAVKPRPSSTPEAKDSDAPSPTEGPAPPSSGRQTGTAEVRGLTSLLAYAMPRHATAHPTHPPTPSLGLAWPSLMRWRSLSMSTRGAARGRGVADGGDRRGPGERGAGACST
jgi:hypothetical protein